MKTITVTLALALSCSIACADPDSDDGGDPIDEPAALAHDIDIAQVEINQGVAIPIALDGEWIESGQRVAPIVSGRPALVRVHWTLGPDFEPRPIAAQLTLERPGQAPSVREEILTIEAESDPGNLDATFNFELSAEDMTPDLRLSVALVEVESEYAELAPPDVAPIIPRAGEPAFVEIRPEPATMKVVLVPLELAWPGCSTTVDVTTVAALYEDMLFMKSPTQALTIELRDEPLVVTTEPSVMADMLEPIQQLRLAEQADPDTYYYGVLEPCGVLLEGPQAVAPIAYADPLAGWLRIGVGSIGPDPQRSADLFVHQVGHLQGLQHVDCPGEVVTEPDLTYPYTEGLIGAWGFGLRDQSLHDPTSAHDFMSQCYDGNWASDWTWNKAFERIVTVTSWATQDAAPRVDGTLLLGWIGDDGHQRWWSIPGRIPAHALAHDPVLALASADGRSEALVGARHRIPDAEGSLISLELPDQVPETIELTQLEIAVPPQFLASLRAE